MYEGETFRVLAILRFLCAFFGAFKKCHHPEAAPDTCQYKHKTFRLKGLCQERAMGFEPTTASLEGSN
jgi:hypothetical protein